ncbi:ROK family protein [Chloroflexota bacterium]
MSDWVVGVDLGGTKIELGLVDPQDRIIDRRRMPTDQHEGAEAVVERIAQSVGDLQRSSSEARRIAALGICSPGPLDHRTGMLMDPPNLPGLHNTALREMLAERLDLPVRLEHDAKAAALGEFHYGAGRGESNMVYIVVGTGVGAAIIIDGKLYRGERNFAGEVGHITLDRTGEVCHCGTRGCAETYMSGPRLARRYQRALEQVGQEIPSREQQAVTGEMVARLAAQGEPLASQVMESAGEALGLIIASMAMTLNIDLHVVGGSVAKSGDLLLEPARRIVPQYSFQSVGSRVRIVSTECGDDGPILGCAWLARQALAQS